MTFSEALEALKSGKKVREANDEGWYQVGQMHGINGEGLQIYYWVNKNTVLPAYFESKEIMANNWEVVEE